MLLLMGMEFKKGFEQESRDVVKVVLATSRDMTLPSLKESEMQKCWHLVNEIDSCFGRRSLP